MLPAFTPNVASDYPPNLEGERRENGYCEHLQILLGRDNIACMYSIHTPEGSQHVEGMSCSIRDARAMRLFQDFIDLAQESEHHHPQLQQHLLSAFFWAMFHELDAGHEFYTAFKDSHISSSKKTADELRDYIKANLRHVLTIEKMARHLYMSPRQFTRYLRQETGQSFVEILTECRIEESKRFLTETSLTIDGIAWMLASNPQPISTRFSAATWGVHQAFTGRKV